jgi:hypothetical protein
VLKGGWTCKMKLQLTVSALLQQLHRVGAVWVGYCGTHLLGSNLAPTFCSPITIECVLGNVGINYWKQNLAPFFCIGNLWQWSKKTLVWCMKGQKNFKGHFDNMINPPLEYGHGNPFGINFSRVCPWVNLPNPQQ